MKKFRMKITSIIMILTMIISVVGTNITTAFADENSKSINVNIAVVGMYNEVLFKPQQIKVDENATAEDVLKATGLSETANDKGMVTSIASEKNGTDDGNYGSQSGWMYKVNFTTPQVYPKDQSVKDGDYLLFVYAKNESDLLPSYDSTQNDFVDVTVKNVQKDNNFSEQVTVLKKDSINAAIMEALKRHGEDFDKAYLVSGALMSKDDTKFWSYTLNDDNSTYNEKNIQLKAGDIITTFKDDGDGIKEINVESINLDKSVADLIEGDTLQLNATVNPGNATNQKVDWTSSDPTIVEVDANGKITALKSGKATITAESDDNKDAKSQCTVTVNTKDVVNENKVTKVDLDKTSASIKEGETVELKATITPSDATNGKVDWTSSDTSIATVDENGKVTAVKAGTATITAASDDNKDAKAQCAVTVSAKDVVNENKVTKVDLDKTSTSVKEGETVELKATITPTDATNTKVAWTSSDTSIATVDENGKVTAVKAGTATITAASDDNKDAKAQCTVTVSAKDVVNENKVTKVDLDKTSASIKEGETVELKATITPTDATNTKIAWTSSDESIATVDENGKVTAVKAGTATITAASDDNKDANAQCIVTVVPNDDSKLVEMTNQSSDTSVKLGNDAKISIKVVNNSDKDQYAVLVVALYDESGNLIKCASGETTIKKGDFSALDARMSLPSEGKYTLKAFACDSLENMKAISNTIDIPIK